MSNGHSSSRDDRLARRLVTTLVVLGVGAELLAVGKQGGAQDLPPSSSSVPLPAVSAADADARVPAPGTELARESPVSVPVPQRLTAWQSRLAEGWKVEAEKVVGGFGYAFARP
ncbi:MAG TPA: hypothetical protein PKL73_15575, partial [Polyangiaceae bacterium]|nr:hypothetical protein [Polyangiaceae bacterium]HNZ22844.1 hypothetical protein [Polyangiaceae bacterium]HOH00533.1 hypothetical protein [Polyangiaceae bacterium]HOR35859.1 hypothetical protein [Polyangiaceae bacterium]HPK93814.1 hypothetical protein [Polyangiaceae bacterium]